MSLGSVLVMGAGDAIGSAIVRKFAARGYTVCAARRNADKLAPLVEQAQADGHDVRAFACDARQEDSVTALINTIETEIAPLEVVVFNVGANVPMGILETDSRKFHKIWEMACFGGFLTGREGARVMLPRERGTILFTGATASMRGGAGFAAFASAKHGLRALAQSMARELGPKNIHVGHIVIDAAVDTAWIAEMHPRYAELKEQDGVVNPDDLAELYVQMHEQPRNAWTFELDVRPWIETW